MNLKHKVLTGNPTRNSRCQALASRALNTSCYFGQSARSIESRCVVKGFTIVFPQVPYFEKMLDFSIHLLIPA